MKYKLSALILGITFAGVSQAAIITVNYTLTAPIFGAAFANGDTQTLGAGFIAAGSVNLDTNGTPVTQTLFTVLYTPSSNTVTSSSVSDSTTITVTGALPAAAQIISDTFLDTLIGAPVRHTLSTSSVGGPILFTTTGTGYRVTVTPLNITTLGPIATTGTGQNVLVQASFSLAAPEPGTWVLLGSSLIGLGLFARRRKTVSLN